VFANTLVPVETSSKVAAGPLALLIVAMHQLVGSRANWLSRVKPSAGAAHPLIRWGSSKPWALALDPLGPLVALCVSLYYRCSSLLPQGEHNAPHKASPEPRIIFLRVSTEPQATKPSRRWQPLRVISTTTLQLEHIVPLDAILTMQRTRITLTCNWFALLQAQVS
jgi:hypothetical protein